MKYYEIQKVGKYFEEFEQILKEMAEKMLINRGTNSITIEFSENMIIYYESSIKMCEILQKYTNSQAIHNEVQNIKIIHNQIIEKMKEIIKNTPGYINIPKNFNNYMKSYFNIIEEIIGQMKNMTKEVDINIDFANKIRLHQEGSAYLCDNLLKYYIDPKLKEIATIIRKGSQIT